MSSLKPSTVSARRRRSKVRELISAAIERLEERWLFSTYYDNAQVDASGAGTQQSPWNSLSAISAYTGFQPGDVVKLSGTFNNQTIALGNFATGVTVTSADTTNPAVITESADHTFSDAIEVTTAGVTISYLTLVGPGITSNSNSNDAIDFKNPGSTQLAGVTVDHVNESGFVFAGLNIQGNTSGFTNVTVTNSTFNDNQVSGVVISAAGIGKLTDTAVLNNNVQISNVTASGNAGAAIYYNANNLGPTQDAANGGIYVSSIDGGIISHCTAIGNCYNSFGAGAIWAYDCNNLNVEYCEAADTLTTSNGFDGNGFDFDHDVSNSIMQYDYSHGNDGSGLYMCSFDATAGNNNDTIRYSISDDDGRDGNAGCRIYGVPGHYVTNANVYNNTILATDGGEVGFEVDGRGNGYSGCTVNFMNNIVCTSDDSEAVEFPSGAPMLANVKLEGNDYWVTGYGTNIFKLIWGSTTYQSFNAFVNGTGEETINGKTVGFNKDPLLNNEVVSDLPIANVSNLALSNTSPAWGGGLILSGTPFSNTTPYSSNAPYNLAGSAWNGIGTQNYFGLSLDPSTANDIGAGGLLSSTTLTGKSAGDTFRVKADPTSPDAVDVNGVAYKRVNGLTINGSTGNETVIADLANGPFSITFNGGSGVNSLITLDSGTGSPATQSIIFNPKGDLNSLNVSAGTVTVAAGTQSGLRKATFSNITIAANSEVAFAQPSSSANRTLIVMSGSMSLAGMLDLGGNDLIVPQGKLALLTNEIQLGLSGVIPGSIVSKTASTNIALAVVPNTVDGSSSGAVLYSTFDAVSAVSSDVLIKSTYNGDVNLDGTVDSTDYARVDAGFANHLSGWINGDFNYDGVINGLDYTMMDNAFNSHGANLAAQVTTVQKRSTPAVGDTAIPEFSQQALSDALLWLQKHAAHKFSSNAAVLDNL